jgi:hypothetical protein
MSTILTGYFETRREAEMSVERLVQEYGVDRSRILVAAAGSDNSAGVEEAGSDTAAGAPTPESRHDAALNGSVMVSVDLADDATAQDVRAAFAEFRAESVDED